MGHLRISTDAIDRIVANVLGHLSPIAHDAPAAGAPDQDALPDDLAKSHDNLESSERSELNSVALQARVVTASAIEGIAAGTEVVVSSKAIVTPAALDVIKARDIRMVVQEETKSAHAGVRPTDHTRVTTAYIVRHTESLQRAWEEFSPTSKTELLGCPDDAAQMTMSAICRGDSEACFIFAEQAHRAACFANRNEKVRAVVAGNVGDVIEIRKQIRANVWCVNPTGRSYFELRNLFNAIRKNS